MSHFLSNGAGPLGRAPENQDLPAPVQARCGSMVCSTLPLISDRVIALRLDPLPKVLIVVVAWVVVGASILEFISIRMGAPQATVSSNLAIITAAHADGRALQKNLMPAALSAFRSTAFQRLPGQRQQDGDCTKQKPRTHHNLPLLHGVNIDLSDKQHLLYRLILAWGWRPHLHCAAIYSSDCENSFPLLRCHEENRPQLAKPNIRHPGRNRWIALVHAPLRFRGTRIYPLSLK
jgi:hypothetical protein